MIIEIPDDAVLSIKKAAGILPTDDLAHALLYICGVKVVQDEQLQLLRRRVGPSGGGLLRMEISDRALAAINNACDEQGFGNFSEAITNVFTMERQQDAWIKSVKKRLGEAAWKRGIGELPLFGEKSDTPKLVLIDAMFNDRHYHAGWGADCPVCHQYIHEDIDTEPMPKEERLKACDHCEQPLELLYPWEYFKRLEEKHNGQ